MQVYYSREADTEKTFIKIFHPSARPPLRPMKTLSTRTCPGSAQKADGRSLASYLQVVKERESMIYCTQGRWVLFKFSRFVQKCFRANNYLFVRFFDLTNKLRTSISHPLRTSTPCLACLNNALVFNKLQNMQRQSTHFKEYFAANGYGSHLLSI